MSFITQCPACETQFKVAPDQLKISEGWVRCGQCQHVFDASLNLQPWWPEPEPESATEVPAPTPPTDQAAPDLEWHAPPAQEDLQEPRFDLDVPVEQSSVSEAPIERMDVPEAHNPATPRAEPAHRPEPQAPVAVAQPMPSFMKKAMEKAYWHRTSVRFTLYALIALLVLALGVQWFYRHKNEWASSHPDLRPMLIAACAVLRCEIEVPRKLSEVVIDSSSFVRGTANRFDFQLMLRNRADTQVAMPTLELTLTDIENQVIARRIIAPTEWPEQPTILGPQAVWSLRLELLLDMPPTQIVTGYQAELFYP